MLHAGSAVRPGAGACRTTEPFRPRWSTADRRAEAGWRGTDDPDRCAAPGPLADRGPPERLRVRSQEANHRDGGRSIRRHPTSSNPRIDRCVQSFRVDHFGQCRVGRAGSVEEERHCVTRLCVDASPGPGRVQPAKRPPHFADEMRQNSRCDEDPNVPTGGEQIGTQAGNIIDAALAVVEDNEPIVVCQARTHALS